MTKKIGLVSFVISLFLSVFTMNIVSVKAYSGTDFVVQPYVFCDIDFGCRISTGVTTNYEIGNVLRMAQKGMSWSGLYLTENPVKTPPSNATIGVYGCAVVAQAVIVSKFSGVTHFPDEVNNALPNSISFSARTFETVYTSYVDSISTIDVKGKSFDQIYDLIKPELLLGRLIMIRSEISSSDSDGHYEVAYGFTERTDTFTSGPHRFATVKVRDSSDYNDTTLSSFLYRYPYPKHLYIFEDKTK